MRGRGSRQEETMALRGACLRWWCWAAVLLTGTAALLPVATANTLRESVPVDMLADDWWRYHLERLARETDSDEASGRLEADLQLDGLDKRKHILGTRALVEANGYPVEEHEVRSADGYLLTAFRVPRPGRPVVFLMHGLLSSSADYVFLGKGRALALLLHDAGFDVWMGNARGNTASRRHERLKPSQAKFWDFTWHQIGVYDLPALIDHVLAATNQTTLHYVGHSQGTTTFFVLGSERPEYMDKVKTYTALAPVAFLRDVRSIPIRIMSLAPNTLAFLLKIVGVNAFLPSSSFISWLGDTFCANGDITQPLCYNIVFLICGTDSQQLNKTALPDMLANVPAGASTLQLLHYGQLVDQRNLVFRQFDHGWLGNMAHYRSLHPPEYDLSRVTARTFLVHADNDLLAVQSNIEELTRRLPNVAPDGVRRVPFAKFNHLDFLTATNAKELVYDDVIATLQDYEATATAAPSTGGR